MASSLALALGASIASAVTTSSCDQTNGIGICTNGNSDIYSNVGFIWNGLNGGTTIYQPALSSGTTPVTNLAFYFNNSTSSSGDSNKITVNIANTVTSLDINGAGKTLQMGDGSGTIDFGFGGNTNKTINLYLGGLKGNLRIGGGPAGSGNATEFANLNSSNFNKNNIVFSGNFSGNIEGNITTEGAFSNLIFSGNNTVIGGDTANTKTIKLSLGSNKNRGYTNLTFNGETNTINSSINITLSEAFAGYDYIALASKIVFSQTTTNNTIAGNISLVGANNWSAYTYSEIAFNNTSGSNTISGNINIGNTNYGGGAQMVITLGGNGANSNPQGTSLTNTISGSISSSQGNLKITFNGQDSTIGNSSNPTANIISSQNATTNIAFTNNGAQNIYGNIVATYSGSGAKNIITFGGTGKIENGVISAEKQGTPTSNATITGRIVGNDSTNYITFFGSGENTIGQTSNNGQSTIANITKDNATISGDQVTNTIAFKAGKNTIYGDIFTTTHYSGKSMTTISFEGTGENKITGSVKTTEESSTSITFGNTSGDMSIGGKVYSKQIGTDKSTTISFEGSGNATIGAGGASTGEVTEDTATIVLKGGKNIINFNNTGAQTINGGVYSVWTTDVIVEKNYISFGGGNYNADGTLTGNTTANTNEMKITGGVKNDGGVTKITFGNSNTSGNMSIGGRVYSVKYSDSSEQETSVSFAGNGNATIGASSALTGEITADTATIVSQGMATNLTFSNTGVKTINGHIYTASSTFGGQGQTIINFGTTASANSITGGIKTIQGTTQITANSASIAGGISATNAGTNTIRFGNGTSSIGGDMSVSNGGASSSNSIASEGTLSLGASGSRISITSQGSNVSNSIASNTLNAYINNLTTSSDWFAEASNNTIEAVTGTIDITSMSATLAKEGQVSENRLTITSGDDNSSLTIGSISSNQRGQNTIVSTAKTNLVTGTIDARTDNAGDGINNISFSTSMQVNGNITKSGNGANNFTFTADSGTLTLKGNTSQISTLTAVSGNATNKDTLILDTTNNANATSIDKVVNGSNLIVSMKGNATNSATLTLNNSSTDSTIKTLNLTEATSSVDSNILAIEAGTTTILDEVNIALGKGLTTNLNGTSTTLELDNGFFNSGNAKISFEGSNGVFDSVIDTSGNSAITTINIANNQAGTITGDIAQDNGGANNIVFGGGTAKLALQGSNNTLSSVNATQAGILSLDGARSQSGVQATITTLTGNSLTANFNGTQDKKTELVLSNGDGTLAGVTLENNSTNNTLTLSSGKTTITGAVNIEATQGITFELANNTELSLGSGMSGDGNSVANVAKNSSATLSGGKITLKTANLSGENSTLTLSAQNTNIITLNANATTGNTLALDSTNNNVVATVGTISNTNNNLTLAFKGNATYSNTLNLENKAIQNIKVISGANNNVIFSGSSNTIAQTSVANGSGIAFQVNDGAKLGFTGALDNSNGGSISFDLKNGSELTLHKSSTINSLSVNNATIDIHNMDASPITRGVGNQLVIGNNGGSYKGVADFIVDVGISGVTDTVVFKSVAKQDNGSKSEAVIKVLGSYNDIINKATDTLVAKVYDTGYNTVDGSTANMEVVGGKSLVGGTQVEVLTLNQQINYDSISYYIGEVKDIGAPIQYQEVASSALTVNYDLYLANFNSLNKRMGELRNSEDSNGVWARVFGGAMSNDFGAGSKTEYITAQAGYDYALSVGNDARNHLGIAVAYGTSNTQGNTLSMNGLLGSSGSISLNEVDSNMVEVGIYNTFISDSGWYNDTIFKFDYIMSEFSLSNDPNTMSSTSNFAMVLSDEFGYRYKFAENEKGSWYIDPQAEVAFGYFNQSDFNRVMYNAVGTSTTMQATQDSILTLRTRIGASLGKKFNTDKGFASLYVGAFYEYDYINGGSASMQGRAGGTTISLDSLESNGRAVLNVGSNIELTKGARLYIDVEKSFGDKQRTFMQFNLGARYSF